MTTCDSHMWLSTQSGELETQQMTPLMDGLAQDCSNCSALTVELLQSYAKPSTYLCTLMCAVGVSVVSISETMFYEN